MRFGEKLSFLRKQHGMTQLELAEKLDISRQAVSRWECGSVAPSTENLVRVGELFGVSVDALMDEHEQFREGSSVQVAVKEPKSEKSTRLTIAVCLAAFIAVLIVIFCCVSLWKSGQATKGEDPIAIEDLEQTELDDGLSSSFYMEPLGE